MLFNELCNALENDHLVDWLACHGQRHGFKPDLTELTQPRQRRIASWPDGVEVDNELSLRRRSRITMTLLEKGTPLILNPVLFNGKVDVYLTPDALLNGHPVMITTTKYQYNRSGALAGNYFPTEQLSLRLAAAVTRRCGHFILWSDETTSPPLEASDLPEDYVVRITDALAWIQRVREQGADWDPYALDLFEMSPNMNNMRCTVWDDAKAHLAAQRREPTLMWQVTRSQSEQAWHAGIRRWDTFCEPHGRAFLAKIISPKRLGTIENILTVNNPKGGPLVIPEQFPPLPQTRYIVGIDFETIPNFQFPELPHWIFMIGIVVYDTHTRQTSANQWTLPNLHPDHQREMIRGALTSIPPQHLLLHWSHTEKTLVNKWDVRVDGLNWHDLLHYFRENAIAIRGAFNYSLKQIAQALGKLKLIQTPLWKSDDEVRNGYQAMCVACHHYTRCASTHDLAQISQYNLVDCHVLIEIDRFIRSKV